MKPEVERLRADLEISQRFVNDADRIMMEQSAELEGLRKNVAALEDALVTMREQRDEQFKRAERLLRMGMHPEDLALDTAAGNDPDR